MSQKLDCYEYCATRKKNLEQIFSPIQQHINARGIYIQRYIKTKGVIFLTNELDWFKIRLEKEERQSSVIQNQMEESLISNK